MDINLLFEAGMMACGRVLRVLPEKEIGSPKQYMSKVLRVSTLPSINKVYPYIMRTVLDVNRMNYIGIKDNYVGWRIPKELTNGLEIQSIKSCYPVGSSGFKDTLAQNGSYIGTNTTYLASYPNKYGRYSSANLYESVLSADLGYADLQLLGSIQEAPNPRLEKPNIMWINSTYQHSGAFLVELCLDNDDNLLTLDNSVYDGVKRLFILDLKSAIYNEYGILSNIETPLGNIDLRIDDWSGAESERNELYDQYLSLAHLRRNAIKSF